MVKINTKSQLNKSSGLGLLVKDLEKLGEQEIKLGWFDSQGFHSSAVEFTFAELAEYHANGGGGRVPVRDILGVAEMLFGSAGKDIITKPLLKYIADPKKYPKKMLLKDVAIEHQEFIRDLFGTPLLNPTANNQFPLIDTGELMDNLAYKINKGAVKK